MVRVNRPPNFHHDHVATLRLVDPVKAGSLIVCLVQTGVFLALPPAIGTLEGFEFKTPLALVPVCADLPAVPRTMYERALQQLDIAGRHDRAQVALWPAKDVPWQRRRLAHGQVAR